MLPVDGAMVAAARVALVDDTFVAFPADDISDRADLSVFVAVNHERKLLSMALDHVNDAVPERVLVDAIAEGIEAASAIIPLQQQFREMVLEHREREGHSAYPRTMPKRVKQTPEVEDHVLEEVYAQAREIYKDAFVKCRQYPGKAHRAAVVTDAQQSIVDRFLDVSIDTILPIANRAARDAHREVVLRDGIRIDGREFDDIRPIRAEMSVLPGDVHGSAIFERGDTQVLACSTIGLKRQAIRTEEYVEGGENKPFFVHYSFPSFATGEYGRFGANSSRREIGHSALAESAIEPLLSAADKDYPYALRLSAEVLGSDGSSSMATVCAGSLALLNSGAPLKEPVAGVAMGLLSRGDDDNNDEDGVILTDILGAEDHFGEMDMKVTGTNEGVTACQLDTKRPQGLALALVEKTFEKAKTARASILADMSELITEEPCEMPHHAPKAETLSVSGLVAIQTMMKDRASGLREVEAATDAKLTFDGKEQTMVIEAPNGSSLEQAKKLIALKMNDLEIGTKLEATISEVKRSYAVVKVSSGGVSGILHVSKMQANPTQSSSGNSFDEMRGFRYPDARDLVTEGEAIEVVVLESDRSRNILRLGLVSPPENTSKETLDEEIDSILTAASGSKSQI